ncbi:MAG: hypothetical protein LKI53_06330 [Bacteroidales bacterium]|nr:hypothetical protein [Bacteroidales bacterium]
MIIIKRTLFALKALEDFILPRSCRVCGKNLMVFEKHICLECLADFPFTGYWRLAESPADDIFAGRVKLEKVHSLFFYSGAYKKLIYAVKYKSDIGLGKFLGRMLGKSIMEFYSNPDNKIGFPDYIVPVPLHFMKKLKRGYNQSEVIAEGISQVTGIKIEKRLLKRRRYTKTQTRKDRTERWLNVKKAFRLTRYGAEFSARLFGQDMSQTAGAGKKPDSPTVHFLVVDDVLTTGATLEVCCSILRDNFDCPVSAATVAFVE